MLALSLCGTAEDEAVKEAIKKDADPAHAAIP